VLIAIEFNNNAMPMIGEIKIISAKRDLAAEMKTVCVRILQFPPQKPFGFGRIAAERA
jgi:hypothetical protein